MCIEKCHTHDISPSGATLLHYIIRVFSTFRAFRDSETNRVFHALQNSLPQPLQRQRCEMCIEFGLTGEKRPRGVTLLHYIIRVFRAFRDFRDSQTTAHSVHSALSEIQKPKPQTVPFSKIKFCNISTINHQQTQSITGLTAPYRNRTKTVPQTKKTYHTVRFGKTTETAFMNELQYW